MPWDISGVLRGPAIVVYFGIRTGVCPQFPDDIFLLTVSYAERVVETIASWGMVNGSAF